MANSHGSYRTTADLTMRAYDGLPREVRKALQSAVTDWAVQPIVTAFEKRGVHRTELVRRIKRWDKQELAKREDQRCRAVGVYKGLLRDPSYRKPRVTRKGK